jgi:hypothetical protein
MCALVRVHMCLHAAIYVLSYEYICVFMLLYIVAEGTSEGVTILLYMCPHTAIYVSSYCYICILILLYMCPHATSCRLHLLQLIHPSLRPQTLVA